MIFPRDELAAETRAAPVWESAAASAPLRSVSETIAARAEMMRTQPLHDLIPFILIVTPPSSTGSCRNWIGKGPSSDGLVDLVAAWSCDGGGRLGRLACLAHRRWPAR